MRVEILNYTRNAIDLVSMAARTCYNSRQKDPLMQVLASVNGEIVDPDRYEVARNKQGDFIAGLIKSGHESPLEHVTLTLDIKSVSRALLAQLSRHRIASLCVESQRYVKYDEKATFEPYIDYVVPPFIVSSGGKILEDYIKAHSYLHSVYCGLLNSGVKAEDARMVLPQSFCTNLVLTMNIRALRNFFKLRLDSHAQAEIRELATEMYKNIAELEQGSWEVFFKDLLPEGFDSK